MRSGNEDVSTYKTKISTAERVSRAPKKAIATPDEEEHLGYARVQTILATATRHDCVSCLSMNGSSASEPSVAFWHELVGTATG